MKKFEEYLEEFRCLCLKTEKVDYGSRVSVAAFNSAQNRKDKIVSVIDRNYRDRLNEFANLLHNERKAVRESCAYRLLRLAHYTAEQAAEAVSVIKQNYDSEMIVRLYLNDEWYPGIADTVYDAKHRTHITKEKDFRREPIAVEFDECMEQFVRMSYVFKDEASKACRGSAKHVTKEIAKHIDKVYPERLSEFVELLDHEEYYVRITAAFCVIRFTHYSPDMESRALSVIREKLNSGELEYIGQQHWLEEWSKGRVLTVYTETSAQSPNIIGLPGN